MIIDNNLGCGFEVKFFNVEIFDGNLFEKFCLIFIIVGVVIVFCIVDDKIIYGKY